MDTEGSGVGYPLLREMEPTPPYRAGVPTFSKYF